MARNITAEMVKVDFVIDEDEPPISVQQVKITSLIEGEEHSVFLDPDEVLDFIRDLNEL